ncbi:endopeptidase La [Clostridium perfringens]|jgi:ATP-dependent Lon protease|uniref:Lon protease n=4 Tax=Clostridium perfringens TaxID=1502 RepID=Q8XKK4_CLOPE|nr:endopeptidase La [Clostridium perfringens]EDT13556.1 ATP-dependent protease La [Clostridium perfringens E str. JGS1987]EGT0695902.1 endopeptidase La [Clostridium perfringens]EGT3602482.1 endopeptidase La [Clostridium perfringens]EHK2278639.1 endopeptidase La [Clostridium perfringens]EHK2344934.1 endopeptidase La [Clostridium perfringens]
MKEDKLILPLIPLRGLTVFPNMVIYFDVGREKSIEAVEKAMAGDQKIFLAAQKDIEIDNPSEDDIFNIGTICEIKQIVKMPKNTIRVLVEGIERAKMDEFFDKEELLEASIEKIDIDNEIDHELEALSRKLKDDFFEFLDITASSGINGVDLFDNLEEEKDLNKVTDLISSYALIKQEDKQDILQTLDLKKRIEKLIFYVKEEIEVAKIEKRIGTKVKKKLDKGQREYYLREQMKVIQEELGEDDDNKKAIIEFEKVINEKKLPNQVKEKAQYEISKLKASSPYSQDGGVTRTYLENLLDMPWGEFTEDTLNIKDARKVLDKDHYGLKDVKDRILEYLAVKQISNSLRGPILCLVGPPGVGKTSIAKSVATSLNRKFVRMSLGGVRDEADIRGHRRTYVGAIPGRIVTGLKEAKSMNPVFLLDEIDKLGMDFKGNPADALLEVFDNEQNKTFRDHYLEVDVDLSEVMFITTANSLDGIPRPLLDRMELIEVSGYTYEEKFRIAKKYLVPKVLKEHGVDNKIITISDSALKLIIDSYTRESGVRNLQRQIANVIRKGIKDIIEKDKKNLNISTKLVEKYLGPKIFSYEEIDKEDKVGVVTGMAWTAYGGDTLPVEVMVMDGKGRLELTGQLGDVMKESARAAYSYVRAHMKELGIKDEFYSKKDIHIHAPEGAVPKDGPSAGVTMTTALVSALTGKKVKHNVAMTGEITLTGKVLAIGGLKEKCLAARRVGIDTVIVPKENEKDVIKLPKIVKDSLNIILADKIDDVLENALVGVEK